MKRSIVFTVAGLFLAGMLLAGCGKGDYDSATGWKLNDQEWGGYEKVDYKDTEIGPNLVQIPGGTFLMGQVEEDVMFSWNNVPRQQTVSSFYMDETEVSNYNYRLYTMWNKNVFGEDMRHIWLESLPDTLVWREELAFNEPMVEEYFRHPAWNDYPVVGVNWEQAVKYTSWRSDRVNEAILIKKGVLNPTPDQKNEDNFTTDTYLAGQYDGDVRKNMKDIATGGERRVNKSDGILLPEYRLPTEAEWEYAALALIGNMVNPENEIISDRRIYPWNGTGVRYQRRDKSQGKILANFKKGAGDYMGVAGNLNDNASFAAPVKTYYPNDFGLYNMAGNVSEWVLDVYRPMTSLTVADVEQNDLNPFRGNVFTEVVKDENGKPVQKDSTGRLVRRNVTAEAAAMRDNYDRADVRDYQDGDQEHIDYLYGKTTLVNNETRVVKGGSWADRAYWLAPGTRRFMQQDRASKTVGFRCAMLKVGPNTQDGKTGHGFNAKRRATIK